MRSEVSPRFKELWYLVPLFLLTPVQPLERAAAIPEENRQAGGDEPLISVLSCDPPACVLGAVPGAWGAPSFPWLCLASWQISCCSFLEEKWWTTKATFRMRSGTSEEYWEVESWWSSLRLCSWACRTTTAADAVAMRAVGSDLRCSPPRCLLWLDS